MWVQSVGRALDYLKSSGAKEYAEKAWAENWQAVQAAREAKFTQEINQREPPGPPSCPTPRCSAWNDPDSPGKEPGGGRWGGSAESCAQLGDSAQSHCPDSQHHQAAIIILLSRQRAQQLRPQQQAYSGAAGRRCTALGR